MSINVHYIYQEIGAAHACTLMMFYLYMGQRKCRPRIVDLQTHATFY